MPSRRSVTVAAGIVFLIFGSTLRLHTQGIAVASTSEEQEVRDANRALAEAVRSGDVAALDRLFASDVMFVGGDGRVWNKADRLDDYRSRNRVRTAERVEEPNVRVFGNTAIVAFAGWVEGQRDGRPVESRNYLTRVFLRRDGRWQLVHQQSALLERAR